MQLYPFQEEILKKIENKQHVTIETGCGKSMIIVEYAKRHPDSKILLCCSPSLKEQYLALIKAAEVTNITIIT